MILHVSLQAVTRSLDCLPGFPQTKILCREYNNMPQTSLRSSSQGDHPLWCHRLLDILQPRTLLDVELPEWTRKRVLLRPLQRPCWLLSKDSSCLQSHPCCQKMPFYVKAWRESDWGERWGYWNGGCRVRKKTAWNWREWRRGWWPMEFLRGKIN